ncbi:MAG: translation initiation factor IF-2, partial [Gammaproteobacteria bacterium]|nr:translation initiation factor IF-2 [Gammaproteobacteria bacterium]
GDSGREETLAGHLPQTVESSAEKWPKDAEEGSDLALPENRSEADSLSANLVLAEALTDQPEAKQDLAKDLPAMQTMGKDLKDIDLNEADDGVQTPKKPREKKSVSAQSGKKLADQVDGFAEIVAKGPDPELSQTGATETRTQTQLADRPTSSQVDTKLAYTIGSGPRDTQGGASTDSTEPTTQPTQVVLIEQTPEEVKFAAKQKALSEAERINAMRASTGVKPKPSPSMVQKKEQAEALEKAKLAELAAAKGTSDKSGKVEDKKVSSSVGIKGTIHKSATTVVPKKPVVSEKTTVSEAPKDNKPHKNANAHWQDEGRPRKSIKKNDPFDVEQRETWRIRGAGGGRGKKNIGGANTHKMAIVAPDKQTIEVHIPEVITVSDLAHKMSVKAAEVIKHLMKLGQLATINQPLDQETAMIVVEEMGYKAVIAELDDPEAFTEEETKAMEAVLEPRAPIITVMGHVDHGKTSLLDYIRRTRVAAGESGGITQHIGAYHVTTDHGMVTFLDTPGHEAFTAMRARGAQATDIVVLVVAADDGVMQQTQEAIRHAQAANVPIVVAITKIDKGNANIEKVKSGLLQAGVLIEELSGTSPCIGVSSKTGQGIDELVEILLLQAQVLELKAPVQSMAKGLVLEAKLDRGRGAVASLLVQSGTLKVGDVVLAGQTYGRVRSINDEIGHDIKSVGPSIPAEIHGLNGVPLPGDTFWVLADERRAREIATFRSSEMRQARINDKPDLSLVASGVDKSQVLPIVAKVDVQGTHDALAKVLNELSMDEVRVQIVYIGVGGISESDVNLAIASKAIIIGFKTRADANVRKFAENQGIKIHFINIIYEVVDVVKSIMSGLLSPEIKEQIIGTAEVRDLFRVGKTVLVAGCFVIDGIIKRTARVRLIRDNLVISTTEPESLKRFKEDVREVKEGFECGLSLKNAKDIRVGDKIEFFEVTEVSRSIE